MNATLPYPPSANVYWRVFRGRAVLSAEAKKYKNLVKVLLAKEAVLAGPVALTAHVYRPQKSGDLDNRLKVLGDALNGAVWADDKQVVEIHAYRHDDKANPRVEIEVTALAEDVATPGPVEMVEGCVTAGCSREARAGSLHCERHEVSKRLKPKPAVQSAHRAERQRKAWAEEVIPKRIDPATVGDYVGDTPKAELRPVPGLPMDPKFMQDAIREREQWRKTVAERHGEAVAGMAESSVLADEQRLEWARRQPRGVEGELQPLKVKQTCAKKGCGTVVRLGGRYCPAH